MEELINLCKPAEVGLGLESDLKSFKDMGWKPMFLASMLFVYLAAWQVVCVCVFCVLNVFVSFRFFQLVYWAWRKGFVVFCFRSKTLDRV